MLATMWLGSLRSAMVGVPRSRAIADWPAGRSALERVNVDALMEDVVAGRVEFGVAGSPVSAGLASSAAVPLLLLVATAAPFKLFARVDALLRGAPMRFLGGSDSSGEDPHDPGLILDPRADAALMLSGADAKLDAPDAVGVVMDAPCDREPLVLVAPARAAEAAGGSPG